MAPDFSKIKFIEKETFPVINLLQFFDSVVKHEDLNLGQNDVEQILCKELSVDIHKVEDNIKPVLIESLKYYMTIWPGWQRFSEYHSGQLTYYNWYDQFCQYLRLKIPFVIKGALEFLQDLPVVEAKDISTQTDICFELEENKLNAPYAICVSGPPSVLNNIVFEKAEENIVIKQFSSKNWKELTLCELYNWPNVSIQLKLPGLLLSRTVDHHINRHMGLCGNFVVFPEVDRITYSKKISGVEKLQPYSYYFLKCYFKEIIRIINKINGIQRERITELHTLFSEFLKDILEVNFCDKTMCTNICIGYNIGSSRYIRSRKMVKSGERTSKEINFYELITPQVDFSLQLLEDEQDYKNTNKVSFKKLNKLEHKIFSNNQEAEYTKFIIHDCLVYSCTLCKEPFLGKCAKDLLIKHFESVHRGEQSVLCYRCHQEYSIKHLASERWSHLCKE